MVHWIQSNREISPWPKIISTIFQVTLYLIFSIILSSRLLTWVKLKESEIKKPKRIGNFSEPDMAQQRKKGTEVKYSFIFLASIIDFLVCCNIVPIQQTLLIYN